MAKANAAVAIVSGSSLFADSNTNEEAPTLSCANQRNLNFLYYVHIGAPPPPEEWNGEGGTMSKIVRVLSYGKEQCRKVKEVIAKSILPFLSVASTILRENLVQMPLQSKIEVMSNRWFAIT